ncbi:MAG TPA: hypothetical protein PLV17_08595, partial [Spirochaetota bacterium]|nr:hypothetical protein [Spirochaetota bacterium]
MFLSKKRFFYVFLFILFASCPLFSNGTGSDDTNMIASVGIAILAATIVAFISHLFKQPLLLAYIIAG